MKLILNLSNHDFWTIIEKVKEDGAKAAEKTGGGGLEDDDVWGDVDDVSILKFINQIINGNSDLIFIYSQWLKSTA